MSSVDMVLSFLHSVTMWPLTLQNAQVGAEEEAAAAGARDCFDESRRGCLDDDVDGRGLSDRLMLRLRLRLWRRPPRLDDQERFWLRLSERPPPLPWNAVETEPVRLLLEEWRDASERLEWPPLMSSSESVAIRDWTEARVVVARACTYCSMVSRL